MHIGILQAGHVPEGLIPNHGNYDTMFQAFLAERGLSFSNYPVVDGVFPYGPQAADGWLITGSRHGAYDPLPWIAPLEDFIRGAHGLCSPMVGICFGHQIIAQALGGRVEKFSGGWAIGAKDYQIDGIGPVKLNAWHQDQVVGLPADARVVGTNGFCRYPALVYGDHIFTIQPHPEIGHRYLKDLIETRGPGIVPDALLEDASSRLETLLDQARLADHIAQFFKQARG